MSFEKNKKKFGETLAKKIRECGYDNSSEVLEYVSRADLERDQVQVLAFLNSIGRNEHNESRRGWQELLSDAGYDSELVTTVEAFAKYKKYFKTEKQSYNGRSEVLCSFKDIKSRLSKFTCIWAVKKDIDSVKYCPEGTPRREDSYGVSVICLQLSNNFISIKNRYNHNVDNCDCTFGNNPDNIIQGLASAFSKGLGIALCKSSTPDGYIYTDNKLVKYYKEHNGYFFNKHCCVKNWTIEHKNVLCFDNFVMDLSTKKIIDASDMDDAFIPIFNSHDNIVIKVVDSDTYIIEG